MTEPEARRDPPSRPNRRLRVGVSACLLGHDVRYDGRHKRDRVLERTLGPHADLVAVCPEVECGLPVPREPMILTGRAAAPRMVTVRTGVDHTPRMEGWARTRIDALRREELDGFVFKARSPSCGVARVALHDGRGGDRPVAAGLFARWFMERCPRVPVAEEGCLADGERRDHFLERVFLLRRWRDLLGGERTPRALERFHGDHELQLLAHGSAHLRALERVVAPAGRPGPDDAWWRYERLLLEAARTPPTRASHTLVLERILTRLERDLAPGERRGLGGLVRRYAAGEVSLEAPLESLRRRILHGTGTWLGRQTYLVPDPLERTVRCPA